MLFEGVKSFEKSINLIYQLLYKSRQGPDVSIFSGLSMQSQIKLDAGGAHSKASKTVCLIYYCTHRTDNSSWHTGGVSTLYQHWLGRLKTAGESLHPWTLSSKNSGRRAGTLQSPGLSKS